TAAFQTLMQLAGGLEQQEQATQQQDQVAPRETERANGEQRRGQGNQPGDDGQQTQTHDQRQRQADQASTVTLMRGKFIGQNRDKDQVVDAENNLQHHQS